MSDTPVKNPIVAAAEAKGLQISPSAMTAALGGAPTPPELDEKYSATMAPVGAALGLTKLGVSAMTVEPGKRAFPHHVHHGNDELFVILEGEGIYRFGDQEFPIKAGDICAAPLGGPEHAHQIVNTGATTMRYVAIASTQDPDVVEYPDSGKFSALSIGAGRNFTNGRLAYFGRASASLDYWDGED